MNHLLEVGQFCHFNHDGEPGAPITSTSANRGVGAAGIQLPALDPSSKTVPEVVTGLNGSSQADSRQQ